MNGIRRDRIHEGRWDVVMGLVAKTMNKMIMLAGRRKRNFIIDQVGLLDTIFGLETVETGDNLRDEVETTLIVVTRSVFSV